MNLFLKDIRAAAATGRPNADGLVVAEGPHLLAESIRSHWRPVKVICTERAAALFADLIRSTGCESVTVSPKIFASLSGTQSAQGILTLLQPKLWQQKDVLGSPTLAIYCDEIQDPGNAGTIARSAEAFGASGLLFRQGSVRVSNGKFLRAAAGSLFRLPYLEDTSPGDLLRFAKTAELHLIALDARGETTLDRVQWNQNCLVIVGNEGQGVSTELKKAAQLVSIPVERVESLNAGVACSILLYEIWRQRRSQ